MQSDILLPNADIRLHPVFLGLPPFAPICPPHLNIFVCSFDTIRIALRCIVTTIAFH